LDNRLITSPAFLFAVFLWQAQNNRFTHIKKKQRSFNLAMMQACDETIIHIRFETI
jgi:poly(A) polymerase